MRGRACSSVRKHAGGRAPCHAEGKAPAGKRASSNSLGRRRGERSASGAGLGAEQKGVAFPEGMAQAQETLSWE
jgi:hypothetical protein